MSVPCSFVITFWERDDPFALFCVMFSCVYVTFHYGVPGQVWYLIASVPDLCLPLNFYSTLIIIVRCNAVILFYYTPC